MNLKVEILDMLESIVGSISGTAEQKTKVLALAASAIRNLNEVVEFTQTYESGKAYGAGEHVLKDGDVFISKIENNTDNPPSDNWINLSSFANENGDATKRFKVANAVENDEAVALGQLDELVSGADADWDSGWLAPAALGEALLINHGLGVVPTRATLLIKNLDSGTYRISGGNEIVYSSAYFGIAISRVTENNISVYSGNNSLIKGDFITKYDGNTRETDTDNINIKILLWK